MMRSLEIAFEVTAAMIGVSKTLSVFVVLDSATALTDKELWLEANVPTNSGSTQHRLFSDRAADVLASAANQASDTTTWDNTGGFANVRKHKLEVTFTPQEAGIGYARVCVAAASKTLYVSPYAALS
jgi:hypothetical protein